MPLYSIYLVSGPRGTHEWADSLESEPSDWLDLKEKLGEVMRKLHVERGMVEAYLLLQKHLPGRHFVETRHYRKVRVRREIEAGFKIVYSPKTGEAHIKQASFSWELQPLREQFMEVERGKRWRTPPLIPWEHKDLSDPKTFLMEPSGVRYPDYSRTPKHIYALQKEGEEKRGLYEPLQESLYAPRRTQIREAIQEEKKRRVTR